MRHVAIILAGGVGQRMGASIPKQFLELRGKPIIAHTIDNFQRNQSIDDVLIVCNPDWKEHMQEIVDKFGLSKVRWIVDGGATSHDSTRNGIFHLRNKLKAGDFVIVHDAARPILPQKAIDEMLAVAHKEGNASVAIPCYETVIYTDDQKSGIEELERNKLMRVQTPQTYEYSMLLDIYDRAEAENKHDFVYADLVAIYYGKRVFFSKGFVNNIKITTPEDLTLCDSLMDFTEEQLFSK